MKMSSKQQRKPWLSKQKKMANAETEEYEDIAMEVTQTLSPASDNIKEQNNS